MNFFDQLAQKQAALFKSMDAGDDEVFQQLDDIVSMVRQRSQTASESLAKVYALKQAEIVVVKSKFPTAKASELQPPRNNNMRLKKSQDILSTPDARASPSLSPDATSPTNLSVRRQMRRESLTDLSSMVRETTPTKLHDRSRSVQIDSAQGFRSSTPNLAVYQQDVKKMQQVEEEDSN